MQIKLDFLLLIGIFLVGKSLSLTNVDPVDLSMSCTIESAIQNPGKAAMLYQFNAGFCREWIVGSVSKYQKIVITFSKVIIDCENDDRLIIYNEDRSLLLYDYCSQKINESQLANFVMSRAKYLIVRLFTPSSRLIIAEFDLALVDSITLPIVPVVTISPFALLTSFNSYIKSTSTPFHYDYEKCPYSAKEMIDTVGNITSPYWPKPMEFNSNCSWIIKAPQGQKVYLQFDHINLPNDFGDKTDPSECHLNYITISSLNKRDESVYKLCGNRRGIKLITTYNHVLINFVGSNIEDTVSSGFSLTYRMMNDPSDLVPSTTESYPVPDKSTQLNLKCGTPYKVPFASMSMGRISVGRIIGGHEAIPNSWPWQVMITDGMVMCGASLIDKNWLVTAAHCTENINNGPIKAYLGMHNRLRNEPGKVVKFITQVVLHPSYMGRLTQWDYDIALMKLQDPVELSDEISPVCLPPQGVNLASIGEKAYVTGWGDTQGTGPSYVLRQALISIRKNQDCGANSQNMICAGESSPVLRDSCSGDSGGPLIVKNKDNFYLVGIVSWGYDCNGAGVYTKVSNFVNWIYSVVNSK